MDENKGEDRRLRREIANSNERKRMLSINAGFETLKSLLPNHQQDDKMSKAAVLQQTVELVNSLQVELSRMAAALVLSRRRECTNRCCIENDYVHNIINASGVMLKSEVDSCNDGDNRRRQSTDAGSISLHGEQDHRTVNVETEREGMTVLYSLTASAAERVGYEAVEANQQTISIQNNGSDNNKRKSDAAMKADSDDDVIVSDDEIQHSNDGSSTTATATLLTPTRQKLDTPHNSNNSTVDETVRGTITTTTTILRSPPAAASGAVFPIDQQVLDALPTTRSAASNYSYVFDAEALTLQVVELRRELDKERRARMRLEEESRRRKLDGQLCVECLKRVRNSTTTELHVQHHRAGSSGGVEHQHQLELSPDGTIKNDFRNSVEIGGGGSVLDQFCSNTGLFERVASNNSVDRPVSSMVCDNIISIINHHQQQRQADSSNQHHMTALAPAFYSNTPQPQYFLTPVSTATPGVDANAGVLHHQISGEQNQFNNNQKFLQQTMVPTPVFSQQQLNSFLIRHNKQQQQIDFINPTLTSTLTTPTAVQTSLASFINSHQIFTVRQPMAASDTLLTPSDALTRLLPTNFDFGQTISFANDLPPTESTPFLMTSPPIANISRSSFGNVVDGSQLAQYQLSGSKDLFCRQPFLIANVAPALTATNNNNNNNNNGGRVMTQVIPINLTTLAAALQQQQQQQQLPNSTGAFFASPMFAAQGIGSPLTNTVTMPPSGVELNAANLLMYNLPPGEVGNCDNNNIADMNG